VLEAQSESPAAHDALEELCRVYWRPIHSFVQRQGIGPEEAKDITQSFFADLLEHRSLTAVQKEKGRFGTNALANNTTGNGNTAIGHDVLDNSSTGGGNTGVGENAGFNVTTASNVICIGSVAGENIDNSCYIANIYSNIQPVIGIDPDYVTIASNGRLGRSNLNGSSRRFKHDIQPMDQASEVIFALRPVAFRYNKEYDASQRPSFGLIAEDVAVVAPDLVGRNKKGEPESVRYEQINTMLLNEFLKEHQKVQHLEVVVAQQRNDSEVTIADLKKQLERVVAHSEGQGKKIQKVSARVELNRAAQQTVANN
jgi:hypothetical protein